MKIAIWVALGVLPVIIYRQGRLARAILLVILLLSGLSAWIAIYKPSFGQSVAAVSAGADLAPTQPPTSDAPTAEGEDATETNN
jgi:hypothetical protein